MRYTEFRDTVRADLERNPQGLTWGELRERNGLPYDRPCPTWVKALERDIGLSRKRRRGKAFLWQLP